MNRLQATALAAAVGAMMVPLTSWSQAPEQAQLQVPVGQIEAYCDDFRQAMASCIADKGVAAASGALTDAQIAARRECKLHVQEEFDLHTASFCPGPEVSLAAADYASMCVALNQKTLPCLEELGYAAVVGQPLTPEEHAYLHHCREESGADMALAKRCGPPAYAHAP
jgi:hypothetical protein